jgi:hypothetical protein
MRCALRPTAPDRSPVGRRLVFWLLAALVAPGCHHEPDTDSNAEASLVEAKAILDKYQAEVDRWDSEVKRLTPEVERGVLSPQIVLESTNQWKSSIAARNAADATIKKSDAELLSKQATLAKTNDPGRRSTARNR